MAEPIIDNGAQGNAVRGMLLAGEALEAVLDVKGAGTGMLGITNRRLILGDKATPGGLNVMTSLPYARIYSLGVELHQGGMGGKSTLRLRLPSGELSLEFRGNDKARQAHDLICAHLL